MKNRPALASNIANYDDENLKEGIYDMGVIGTTPSILTVTLAKDVNSRFRNFINFTIPVFPNRSGIANSYSLNFLGIHAEAITGFNVDIWIGVYSKSRRNATLQGCTVTRFFGHLPAGAYYLDICGQRDNTSQGGRYSVALQALPVPEPTAYALFLANLGWAKRLARRRKFG